jgi:hypothetical protein
MFSRFTHLPEFQSIYNKLHRLLLRQQIRLLLRKRGIKEGNRFYQ